MSEHDSQPTASVNGEGKKKKEPYDGSKHPMLALQMLNTSSAIEKALQRIGKRRAWIKGRIPELKEKFNSENPNEKKEAHEEALTLKESLSKLDKAEPKLHKMLPEAQEREKAKLEGLVFPEFAD